MAQYLIRFEMKKHYSPSNTNNLHCLTQSASSARSVCSNNLTITEEGNPGKAES